MKIIKEGKIPLFEGKCEFCGCEIQCEKKEGTISYKDLEVIVYCPTSGCGNIIRAYPEMPLSKKKVLKSIKSKPRK